ncbi:MAG: hypothetical protein AAGI01_11875 [Myxococcota bacterium]
MRRFEADPDAEDILRSKLNLAHIRKRLCYSAPRETLERHFLHGTQSILLYAELHGDLKRHPALVGPVEIEESPRKCVRNIRTSPRVDTSLKKWYHGSVKEIWRRYVIPDLGERFKGVTLDELWDELMTPLPEETVNRIESAIRRAQSTRPEDTKGFARRMNAILRRHMLEIRLASDGSSVRLKSNGGYLQFAKKSDSRGVAFKQEFRVENTTVPPDSNLRREPA